MAKRKLPKKLREPVHPDDALAEIIGERARPRYQIIADLWKYFRKKRLNSGQTIRVDAAMRDSGIWGRKRMIDITEVGKALQHAD